MLDGTISVHSLSPKQISIAELVSLCRSGSQDGHTYICRTTTAGSANISPFASAPENPEPCKAVTQYMSRAFAHSWSDEYIIFCNFPCYVVTANGSVITRDHKIIGESVFPSAGEETPSHFLGVHLPSHDIGELVARAGRVTTDKICAAFFSRWSRVYFHAISECLVQDHIFTRTGVRPYLLHLSAENINQVQRKFVDLLQPDIQFLPHDIVDVPRTLFSTVTRRHGVLGLDFRLAIESIRLNAAEQAAALKHIEAAPRLYISRIGEGMRPLANEAEVMEIFAAEGFRVVRPQNLSLTEQARLFSNASVVVGPHGAGLVNAAFAKPRAVVFEMRGLNRKGGSPDMNDSYRKVSAVMGLRYGFHIVENDVDSDTWSIPAATAAQIARCLRDA